MASIGFGAGTVTTRGVGGLSLGRSGATPTVSSRNYDDGLVDALYEAGFSDVTETGHRVSRIMGCVTFYRASS